MAERLEQEDMAAIAASDPMIDAVAAFLFASNFNGYDEENDRYWKDLPEVSDKQNLGSFQPFKARYRRDAHVLLKFLRAEAIAPSGPQVVGATKADRLALQGAITDMQRLADRIKANPFFQYRGAEPDHQPSRYPRIEKL